MNGNGKMDKSCSVRKWRADGLPEDVQFLMERVKAYDVVVHEDGLFTVLMDENTLSKIRRNHLKCLLRHDYQNAGRFLSGAKLNAFLERFMASLTAVAKQVIAKDLQPGREVEIKCYI